MLTTQLQAHIEQHLSFKKGHTVIIDGIHSVSGGSINEAYSLQTQTGTFFLKINNAAKYPGMFECEARGLALLRSKNVIGIPEVIVTDECGDTSFILMEMLFSSSRIKNYNSQLGRQLALLHKNQNATFGLDHNNYMGSVPQINTPTPSGIDFMINNRLIPLVQKAIAKNVIDRKTLCEFDLLYKKLKDLLPDEPPSLLHGDLWNGNVITGPDGMAWLIDPAVCYGYRETDIAMMKLFGGFDEGVFQSYNETFPLHKEWENRVPLFQLYPLLIHLVLFGKGYLKGIKDSMKNYL